MAPRHLRAAAHMPPRLLAAVKRGLSKFLAVPLLIVLGFLILNVLMYQVDRLWRVDGGPAYFQWLGQLLGDNTALNGLLSTIASSIITVTSITFSLLPVAVQQGASSLTAQVADQFLLRRINQVYFGFFIGLAVFVLTTLVTSSSFHRPVFSAALALILTAVALCLIVVMIYNTIDQMRPVAIIGAIHKHILSARVQERQFLEKTADSVVASLPVGQPVRTRESGFFTSLDLDQLSRVLEDSAFHGCSLEVLVPIGASLAFGDPVFQLRAPVPVPVSVSDEALARLSDSFLDAVTLDDDRDLTSDPAYGFYQMGMIGWTSVSTSKSNPGPGIAIVAAIRDILARWDAESIKRSPNARILYADRTVEAGLDLLENTIVVASESIQVGTLTAALDTMVTLLGTASLPLAGRLEDMALRMLSSLGEHVFTARLAESLHRLEESLHRRGFVETGAAVGTAKKGLSESVGVLNSRSTRVPSVQ